MPPQQQSRDLRPLSISTEDVPPAQRASHWQAALARVYLAMSIDVPPARPLHASLEAHQLHDLVLIRASMTAHSGRSRRQIALTPEDERCLLLIALDGSIELSHARREITLRRNDMALIDLSEAFDYRVPDAALVLALNLPRQAVAERLPQSARFAATLVPAGRPMQPITLSYFKNLFHATGAAALHPPTSLRIAGHAVDLLGIALADVIESRPSPSPYRAALLRRIKDFIEAQLHEPLLGVQAVAAKYRISARYLAMLFREDGTTFSDFLRLRRLERCRRQLEGLGGERRPIGEIALAAGFTSQAHFSRLFRATYQKTPRQYRSAFESDPAPRPPATAATKPETEIA
jgi:AraC-like DNA-binding protein